MGWGGGLGLEGFAITDASDVSAKTGTGSTVVMQDTPTITTPIMANIGANGTNRHTVPAVASDTFALLAAAQTLTNKTLTAPVIADPSGMAVQASVGRRAVVPCFIPNSITDGDNVTVNGKQFEHHLVNTDTGNTTANGDFNNTTNPLTVVGGQTNYPGGGLAVGQLYRIENEILRITAVPGTDIVFARGQSGTTIAAHANGATIYEDSVGTGPGAGHVYVGTATLLTPAAVIPAFVADINAYAGGGLTMFDRTATTQMILVTDSSGTGGGVSASFTDAANHWAAASMYGGRASGVRYSELVTRVPKTDEVSAGTMLFAFPFTVSEAFVRVWPTASPNGSITAWNGATTISAGGIVEIDNGGTTDWAATDTVMVLAVGA